MLSTVPYGKVLTFHSNYIGIDTIMIPVLDKEEEAPRGNC